MSGGVGGGNVTGICSELMRVLGSDSKVYVMTGHNDDLRAKLENEYAANDRIATVPFTKEVNVSFNAADILLSKAGGTPRALKPRSPIYRLFTSARLPAARPRTPNSSRRAECR